MHSGGIYLKLTNRANKVPEYIFSKFNDIKIDLDKKGIDIIDLGIGDPDIKTPDFIVNSMAEYIKVPDLHKYPPYSGLIEFKKAVAKLYENKYGVLLDYNTEIAALVGSKEGIAHLFLAATDPGDTVIIPDPAYPVYYAAASIAGCSICKMPLVESNNYIPKLENIYEKNAKAAKVILVNYPNNPTGAIADGEFYKKLVEFGLKYDVVVVNDGAYMNILKNEKNNISLLQTPNARNVCLEFGSLSKSYNMTGWRLGYVAGFKDAIKKLMKIKTNFDSGQFGAIQMAGCTAIENGEEFIKSMNKIYNDRREFTVEKLKSMGIEVFDSDATFYVWFKVPHGLKSEEYASYLVEKTGVIITPGNAFGSYGEGYARISLTVNEDLLKTAMKRIENYS